MRCWALSVARPACVRASERGGSKARSRVFPVGLGFAENALSGRVVGVTARVCSLQSHQSVYTCVSVCALIVACIIFFVCCGFVSLLRVLQCVCATLYVIAHKILAVLG